MRPITYAFVAAASVAAFAPAAEAWAQGPCSALNLPKPVYGTGGSATRPLMRQIATELANQADPVTLFYQDPGACFGVYDTFEKKTLSGSIRYWDKAGVEKTEPLRFHQPGRRALRGRGHRR